MEGRVGLLDRWGDLFGDRRQVVGEAVSPAERKSVRRPPGPMIARANDLIEARAFAVLDYVGEALVALASFTGRLEQVLKLGGLHVHVATANFGGKYFLELFTLL